MDNSTQTDRPNQNATHAGNRTRQRIAGTEPMQPMTRVPSDTLLHPQKLTKPLTSLQLKKQKLKLPRLQFGDNVDARAYSIEDPPTQYNHDSSQFCNGHPTQDWQRRREKAAIKNYNSRHLDQREYPPWITEAEDKYMTTKRPLPLTSEQEDDPQIKKSKLTPPNTSDPNIQHQYNEPVTTESFEQTTAFDQQHPNNIDLPASLDSIKEFIIHKENDSYIPLTSTNPLKKRRRMLYLHLEFGEITIDGLVDSGAYINAIPWSDYVMIKNNTENCIIKEYPQPPFRIECANAQIEQPIATADVQFNIGTYTFTYTFVVLSRTSFPIIGLNLMRNHQALLDTANGTITFPHFEMTLAMKDEMKKCNPHSIQIRTNGTQTVSAQQTLTVNAVAITNIEHPITGTIQPQPQFDEDAQIIVAPALATADNKKK